MPGPHYMLNKFLMISIMGMYSWKRTWNWSASLSSFYKYDNEPRKVMTQTSKSEIKHHVWNSAVQSPSSSTSSISSISFVLYHIYHSLSCYVSLSLSLRHAYKTLCSFGFTNLNFLHIWETITSICLFIFGSGDVIIVECFSCSKPINIIMCWCYIN